MKALLSNSLGILRIIGFLEGISFIVLLFIAMPLKYIAGYPQMVSATGMAHGLLFVLYVFYVLWVKTEQNWNIKTTIVALLASLIPFGTFYADAKIFKTK